MKKKNGPRKRPRPKIVHGEDVLDDVEQIVIVLESGKKATFSIAEEQSIPTDPEELYHEALNAHARFAFWAYQTSRALGKLRTAERELRHLEGGSYLSARMHLEGVRPKNPYIEGARVQAHVDYDEEVDAHRKGVDSLREQWTMIASVRDAIEHRTHLLRRLLKQDQDAK